MAARSGAVIELVDADGSCYYAAGASSGRISFTRSFAAAKRYAADELDDELEAYRSLEGYDPSVQIVVHEHAGG
jgi:hypothetical protein